MQVAQQAELMEKGAGHAHEDRDAPCLPELRSRRCPRTPDLRPVRPAHDGTDRANVERRREERHLARETPRPLAKVASPTACQPNACRFLIDISFLTSDVGNDRSIEN
jgi:hypothetical protein